MYVADDTAADKDVLDGALLIYGRDGGEKKAKQNRMSTHIHTYILLRAKAAQRRKRAEKGVQLTRCGYLTSSMTEMLSSFRFRYWSTLLRVPRIWMLFLSSTVISTSISVLKKLAQHHPAATVSPVSKCLGKTRDFFHVCFVSQPASRGAGQPGVVIGSRARQRRWVGVMVRT